MTYLDLCGMVYNLGLEKDLQKMESSIGKDSLSLFEWAERVPLVGDRLSAPRARLVLLRLTHLGSLSFLGALAFMMLRHPAYFGVIMSATRGQLLLSQRSKICRHQIAAEKMSLTKS
jgi:hypothetical protein